MSRRCIDRSSGAFHRIQPRHATALARCCLTPWSGRSGCSAVRPASGVWLWAAAALVMVPRAAGRESFAQLVPADVGIFVELYDAPDLLETLSEPQLWSTLSELAGQPARAEDARLWRRYVRAVVGMEPEEAIRVLFARGVAFAGPGAGRAQDAVVICRPAANVSVPAMLKRWGARRLPDRPLPETWQLRGSLGVAVYHDVLIFGDLLPPEGMFQRVSRHLARGGRGALAQAPAFSALRARLEPDVHGLVFVRLTRSAPVVVPGAVTTSQPHLVAQTRPWEGFPGPLHQARNAMFILRRRGHIWQVTAIGDGPALRPVGPIDPPRLLARLPATTLVAWQGEVDFARLLERVDQLPPQNVLRIVLNFPNQRQVLERMAAAVEPWACLAVGTAMPRGDRPETPAVALLLRVRDPGEAESAFNQLVDACVAVYNVLSLGEGLPPLPRIELLDGSVGRAPRRWGLDLRPVLRRMGLEAAGDVELCWTVEGRTLVVATSRHLLDQVLRARRGRTPTLAEALRDPGLLPERGVQRLLAARADAVGRLGQRWLAYLRTHAPQVMQESYWRAHQPGGDQPVLGLRGTPLPQERQIRIDAVLPGSPADGFLRPGDRILGAGRSRFASEDVVGEMRRAIRNRPHARWIDLLVERNNVPRVVRVPLPFFDPIQAVRRLVAVGRVVGTVVYYDTPDDHAVRGHLTVELLPKPSAGGGTQADLAGR